MTLPTRTYTVEGMTCAHCRSAVIREVLQVSGVRAVEVDLDRGLLTVAGERFADDAIRAAVDEAGYTVAS
ncbi:MAG: heavy-metal-associated domain-containing protein [Actinobacteria bacterium]|nr:heavy-metal-associated domain-containing protein [Actinomycetota bacterium]